MPAFSSPFTAAERELIRSEFMVRFGQAPRVADGIGLRMWRGGVQAGQPKLSQAVASMIERGLVEVKPGRLGPCACFTPAGVEALRAMARDRRALDPKQYGHVREELGVEAGDVTDPGAA